MKTAPSTVTAHLRAAFNEADLLPLTPLLDPCVSWTGPDHDTRDAVGRTAVLARFGALHQRGLRIAVEETFTYPDAVVLGLAVSSKPGADIPPTVYAVFHLVNGLIARIRGHSDRYQALDSAYTATTVRRPADGP